MNRNELFFSFPSGQEFVQKNTTFGQKVTFKDQLLIQCSRLATPQIIMYDKNSLASSLTISYTAASGSNFSCTGNQFRIVGTITYDSLQVASNNLSNFYMTAFGIGTPSGGTIDYILAGAGGGSVRAGIGQGSAAAIPTASASYASFAIKDKGVTEASSGTHPIICSLGIAPMTITNAAGATDAAASIYVGGAPSGITPNVGLYAIFSDDGANRFDSFTSIGTTPVTTSWLILGAATTAISSLRITSGTAPSAPVDGDIWFDGTNIKMQISGATKTFTLT